MKFKMGDLNDPEGIPVRSELTVIPADGPKPGLGVVVKEYNGCPISRAPAGLTLEEARDRSNWPENHEPARIRPRNALLPGDLVLCPTLSGSFIGEVELLREYTTELCIRAESGTIAYLDWCDERLAWVCVGFANVRAITLLQLER